MTKLIPAEVFPPGEFLREELEARGWTQADFAEILGRPPRLVSEIIGGKRAISPETAQGLGDALGVDPQFWLNLESAYQLSRVRQPDVNVAKRARLFQKAPIKELVRRRWIKASENAEELEASLLKFFGVTSLDQEPEIYPHAARKSSSYKEVTPALFAWLYRARQLARLVQAAPYSEERFPELIARLRSLLSAPEEIRNVARVLSEFGIRLVIVEHLSDTKVDGATLWLDGEPVIALSLRFDRIDYFWFTLFHELGHVKARDGLSTDTVPVDTDLVGQGARKPEEKPLGERVADSFAMECIVSQEKLDNFIARIRPLYSKEKIRGFAAVNEIYPGLVIGQLQYRGEIPYAHSRDMLTRVRDIATRTALTDGWGATPVLH